MPASLLGGRGGGGSLWRGVGTSPCCWRHLPAPPLVPSNVEREAESGCLHSGLHTSGQVSLRIMTGKRASLGGRHTPEALGLALLAHAAPLSCSWHSHTPAGTWWGPPSGHRKQATHQPPLLHMPAPSQSVNRLRASSMQELFLGRAGVEMGAKWA